MIKVTNRSLINYHKKTGVLVALLALVLAITGLLLQHSDDAGWGHTYLRTPWLLDWYSYPEPDIQHLQLGEHQVLQVDDTLLFNQQVLAQSNGKLWGAASNGETILIGSGTYLYWLSMEGDLIDRLDSPSQNSSALASQQGDFYLKSPSSWLSVDSELEIWLPSSAPQHPPITVQHSQLKQFTLPADLPVGISIERLLQDLHSGRLFGIFGVILMDLASVALVLLALTGCWVWLRKR